VSFYGDRARTASELETISLDDEFLWKSRSGGIGIGIREDYISLYESEKGILFVL
jgi:hypothetical protein